VHGLTLEDARRVATGYHPDPVRSMSMRAEVYTEPRWFELERTAIFARSWQLLCHVEKLRAPGNYVAATVATLPIVAIRGNDGELRAFYNVCKHRAHQLLSGEGTKGVITCPYHAWTYDLSGQFRVARGTRTLPGFDPSQVCLDQVRVEEFGGFVYLNLDPRAPVLAVEAGELGSEIAAWAPDVERLTHAHRLTYQIDSNWKNVIDNFLECYHCHVAHKDFVSLVDMNTYTVTTHGIYSSQMAEAGKGDNSAYSVEGATVRTHAVWWLWPNTCLLRYPGRGNFMTWQMLPVAPDRTREIFDFYLETPEPTDAERESIRYIDEVLQVEDIALVESVQQGMRTPAFSQGRLVCDLGSGVSEHAVHHFHGLVLAAYRRALAVDAERSRA
jgi:carnitine monooxygenase subunit